MASEQTRDILGRAQRFHEDVSRYYQQQVNISGRERIRMLLDYLSRHEHQLATSLAEYEDSASEKVLNTWFNSRHELDPCTFLNEFKLTADTSVDDIIELGLRLDDCLIAVYQDLAENAECEEVRGVFQNLLEMEQKEKCQLARNSLRLMDL